MEGIRADHTGLNLSREDREMVERFSGKIVKLGMGTPAILFLESVRPLNFIGSQLLHFLSPMIHAFGTFSDYDRLARLLEDRRFIGMFLDTIERKENTHGE